MALVSMVSGAVQSDVPPLAQASEREASLPWWAWLLIVMILAWLLVRWLNRRHSQDITQPTWLRNDPRVGPTVTTHTGAGAITSSVAVDVSSPTAVPVPVASPPTPEPLVDGPAAVAESTPAAVVATPSTVTVEAAPAAIVEPPLAKPDDLTIIEGIGPKISALLVRSGIGTFNDLAATDVARLRQILLAVGYRVNDPTTWPDQARLAAAGQWEQLKAMQDELKGGRRV
jgi:predicted flap endonuclease-1-like 5' DNA nuclease